MKKIILFIILSLTFSTQFVWAQPDLPNVAQLSRNGVNILSWINPYNVNTKAVFVERSSQIDTGYVSLGFVEDIENPTQFFIDPKPQAGDNYYRVVVQFKAGQEWRSNEILMTNAPESLIVSQNISNDSLKHLVKDLGVVTDMEQSIPTYTPSPYVYVNPYNGNVNIELEDALEEWYVVKFYDERDRLLFEIPRVNDVFVILDKRNFQKNGLHKFKITKNDAHFADGYITIY